MPDTIQLVPTDAIDDAHFPRDRTVLHEAALLELRQSIITNGLRMPIEVVPHPDDPSRFALISGFRRLHAFRYLLEASKLDKYRSIPAILRPAETEARHLTAIIEENEIRAELSPWERGHVIWRAVRGEFFATIDEAVETLFPNANRDKRRQLRLLAQLVEDLDREFIDPELFSLRQALRLATAVNHGYGDLIHHALDETRPTTFDMQWQLLLPILTECEKTEPDTVSVPREGRPRRILKLKRGLNIRRERTSQGWCLHFTGREATSSLLDVVFDNIEHMFSPG